MEHQAFIRQLENSQLPAEEFNHRAHLYAAWAYRRSYPAREAAARCAYALSRYAMSKGAAQKYHHTLTMSILAILYSRVEAAPALMDDWDGFLAANQDLAADAPGVVARHYSGERLADDTARRGFVEPDLAPLPMGCLLH